MLNNGGLEDSVRSGVWAECIRTATILSNIISIKQKISVIIGYWLAVSLSYQQAQGYSEI
jgi:hypothetical protein